MAPIFFLFLLGLAVRSGLLEVASVNLAGHFVLGDGRVSSL
jgi:hypothetical protein